MLKVHFIIIFLISRNKHALKKGCIIPWIIIFVAIEKSTVAPTIRVPKFCPLLEYPYFLSTNFEVIFYNNCKINTLRGRFLQNLKENSKSKIFHRKFRGIWKADHSRVLNYNFDGSPKSYVGSYFNPLKGAGLYTT